MTKRIPIAGPWVTDKEVEYVADAARTAWYENAGHYNRRFEETFAQYVGVRHAVSVPHCTAAIHLSLAALGVGPGDEVIVPDATWIASAAPICYVGASPVFVDVDPKTWCLSVETVERAITPRTKAVIVVDLYGSVPDLPGLRTLADRRGVALIEDAAEAIGSECRGRRAGAYGDTGVFSFHGSKTLTTGEGGMFVTDREDLYRRVLVLRDHGRPPGDTNFYNTEVGFKYRMSSLQAAFGLAQIERAEELVAKKREIFSWYQDELTDLNGVRWNFEAPGDRNSYWMVTLIAPPERGLEQTEFRRRLSEAGIDSRPFFHPLSSLPAFAKTADAERARRENRVAVEIGRYGVNLPSALCLQPVDVRRVAHAVRTILG